MSEIVISFAGPMPQHPNHAPVGDVHTFVPCLQATRGGVLILKVWVELTGFAAVLAQKQLERDGVEDPEDTLNRALLRYGVRRLEARVRELLSRHTELDSSGDKWCLTKDDIPDLLVPAVEKSCGYQRRNRRDLFCLTPSSGDSTAVYNIEGRPAAPTSRATCRSCDLPDTDYLCSNFLHPQVGSHQGLGGPLHRSVNRAICDLGKDEVTDAANCRAGGHACWQRIVEAEPPVITPISPLGLAESFDGLDALWRLAFGKKMRLLSLNTATGPASLSLGCSNRAEFESRLSVVADIIDKLKVDNSLLPQNLPADAIKGSLDKFEKSLLRTLPPVQHPAVLDAIQTLRRVHGARNAIQHGRTEGGGLTATLRTLGIHDAPPNWAGAWDSIRVQTANALTMIRTELRQWVDATTP